MRYDRHERRKVTLHTKTFKPEVREKYGDEIKFCAQLINGELTLWNDQFNFEKAIKLHVPNKTLVDWCESSILVKYYSLPW